MGREIRRVPADWQHPRQRCRHSPWGGGCDEAKAHGGECYKPLYDQPFREHAREWMDDCLAWDNGTHEDLQSDAALKEQYPFYWMWNGGPPDESYYRPEWPEGSATHYQIYETVSEGTPVSPVFASLEELANWLVSQGTSRAAADAFAHSGWVPSGVFTGGQFYQNYDALPVIATSPGAGAAEPQ
jgi:hypothetical protein